jgi:hypothetical protein
MWYNVLPGIGGIGGNGACMYAGPAEPNAGTGYPIKWGWGTASIAFYSREQPVILCVITGFIHRLRLKTNLTLVCQLFRAHRGGQEIVRNTCHTINFEFYGFSIWQSVGYFGYGFFVNLDHVNYETTGCHQFLVTYIAFEVLCLLMQNQHTFVVKFSVAVEAPYLRLLLFNRFGRSLLSHFVFFILKQLEPRHSSNNNNQP